MPNGDTPMQYPFPYKNSSGDTSSGGSTNLDPTFITTTTDTLLVTGNATFQGLIDGEIIVGTFISGSNFTGQESLPSKSVTSQKNSSTNNAAYSGLEAINNNDGIVGIYSYGSSHATRPTSAWLETVNPLKVKGSTTSLFAGTNENIIVTGTNVQLPFLTASRPVSTDASNNLVSASITGTGLSVLQTSPTLVTPTIGAAIGTSLQLSGLTASLPVSTDGSKNLVSASVTGTGSTVLQTSPTLTTPNIGAATGTSLNLSGLTGGLQYAVHSDASKNLISVFNSGSGNNIMSASPTFTGTIQCAGINGTLNFATTGTVTGRTTLNLTGSSSGTVSVSVQSAAGTFNFNLPITAGSTGDVLTSAGGGSSAMTWTGSTGTGNLVRAAGPTLTGTLNCGPVVSTGTVSGTGYVGNTTTISSAGNIGEFLGTGTISTITNGFSYAQSSTTVPGVSSSFANLISINVTPGIYLAQAFGSCQCNQLGRVFEFNFSAGGNTTGFQYVTSCNETTGIIDYFVSYSFCKMIRITALQTLDLVGRCDNTPTLTNARNEMFLIRVG